MIDANTAELIPAFYGNFAQPPERSPRARNLSGAPPSYTLSMPRGEYLQYGGQAIIEGVMMRSPRYFSVACRAPNGQIVVETEAIEKTWIGRQRWLKWPFLRGSLALLDSMALGSKAMRFATSVQMDPKYQEPGEETVAAPSKRVQDATVAGTMVLALVIGFLIFNYLPNALAEYSQRAMGAHSGARINFVAELIKAVLFIGYIWAIGQFSDSIRDVFRYHGAEHKAINTLEHDRPLIIEECKLQTRLHPRCGTSFAIIVLLLGFIVFIPLPRYPVTGHQGNPLVDVTVRVLIEIAILPFIAGIAYELLRIAGKFRDDRLVKMLFSPGLATQYLTTREPREDQIEVALEALKAVVEAEESHPSATKEESNVIESTPPAVAG